MSGGRAPYQKGCSRCQEVKPLEAFQDSARGLHGKHSICKACQAAYARLTYYDRTPGRTRQRPLGDNLAEYIQHRIEIEDRGYETPCWIWQLGLTPKGYARRRLPGETRMTFVHRASYQMKHGQVPDDLVIDHLCQQKSCVNPDHLEPVTIGENLRRYWRQTETA